jgi:3-deoxy-D-manno-octulosonate 8-phosphate phosphatase (KDO 8-P phosphatase)
MHPDGSESKQFDIKDGTGIVCAHRAGLRTGLLSARTSAATLQRASQLSIRIIHQGVLTKLEAYEQILRDEELTDAQVAYMGDDVMDLAVLGRAGLSAAPADAAGEVRERVDWVSRAEGGNGAVRELIELVLRGQRRWDPLIQMYLAEVRP